MSEEQPSQEPRYLFGLQTSYSEVIGLLGQARFCFSRLVMLGDFSADDLKEFVEAIAAIEKTKTYLEKVINNHHKMMTAKPGEIVILD